MPNWFEQNAPEADKNAPDKNTPPGKDWFAENAPTTVAVISPEGEPGHIPEENLQAAQARGFKPAVMVTSPEGESGWMPRENVERAIKERGFTVGQAPTSVEQSFPKYSKEAQSNTRQMAVAGLTGMPTPNMTEDDKASFERGKATGAVTATAVSAAPLVAEAAGPIGTAAKWVKDNPVLAGIGYHVARELGIPLPKMLDVLSKFKE
jgi:hypothetical protein